MPQGQGYGNQKRQTFNYTSAFQNALSTGATAATIHPYLAIPGAAAGFYFGGKSGPFQPSSMDYKPFRDAYEKYENSALKNLRQGVNAIGSQSSQRAASQGLYGSPLGQSIIQNNQNYALNSGLGNINNNRYQFEAGLAQNQFNAQQAYDQQIGKQSIGTVTNLLASTPGIIEGIKKLQNGYISRPVSQKEAERQQLPQRFDRLENGQGAPQARPDRLPTIPEQRPDRLPTISDRPQQLPNIPQQNNAFTQQSTPSAPQQQSTPQAPPKTELEQYGRIVSSELVDEINSMFGDIFDFDSPLAPLGSAIDSAIANQGQNNFGAKTQQDLETMGNGIIDELSNINLDMNRRKELEKQLEDLNSELARRHSVPPNQGQGQQPSPPPRSAPGSAGTTSAWEREKYGEPIVRDATIAEFSRPQGSGWEQGSPDRPDRLPTIPEQRPDRLPAIPEQQRPDTLDNLPGNWGEWKRQIDEQYGITPQAPDNSSAIDIARELIIFGETDASRRYASKPIVDPASGGGYNIGWGRNITHNGLDVQNELIPMLRGGHEVTDNYLRSKLSVAGISMTQEGKVRLTPRQVNRLFPNGINNQMADMLRENDIKAFIPEITQTLGGNVFNTLTPTRQAVLIDMFYTLGLSRFGKFRKMIGALQAGNYAVAAVEMRNSGWYSQVGKRRADPLIAKMIAGE